MGVGQIVEEDEYLVRVKLVDEDGPFTLEHRSVQRITPYLSVTVVNLGLFGPFLLNAYFVDDPEVALETAKRRAENETVHIIDLTQNRIFINQRISNEYDYVWIRCYINRWMVISPEFPRFYDDRR